jgi:hypothetical protein
MDEIRFTLNKHDWISSIRNWIILNAAILITYWGTITDMFYNWSFNWVELRHIGVLSVSSFLLFMGKRFIMGEKKVAIKK